MYVLFLATEAKNKKIILLIFPAFQHNTYKHENQRKMYVHYERPVTKISTPSELIKK